MLRPRSLRPTSPSTPEPAVADYSGIPTTMCPCGGELFKVVVGVDPDSYEISSYTLSGYCYDCGARVTIACPADHADHNSGYVTV